MRTCRGIAMVLLALAAAGPARAEGPCCPGPAGQGFLRRFAPAGGWRPYGQGMVCGWPRHCFPCNSGPDDYCRKPLPRVCWPPYPPYFIWGPPNHPSAAAPGCGTVRVGIQSCE